jgi:hypothetical protein
VVRQSLDHLGGVLLRALSATGCTDDFRGLALAHPNVPVVTPIVTELKTFNVEHLRVCRQRPPGWPSQELVIQPYELVLVFEVFASATAFRCHQSRTTLSPGWPPDRRARTMQHF